jgi:hypothetical protein
MATLTAANVSITLTQTTLFPGAPQQLQGFGVDDVFDVDQIRLVETLMGVDGVLSAGFVFTAVAQRITLQADSASNAFFDTIGTQQYGAIDAYPINGEARLPGLQTRYVMTNGYLTGWKPAPDVKKIVQPRHYEITWAKIIPQPA